MSESQLSMDRGDSIDRTERDDFFEETHNRRTAEIKDIGMDVFSEVWSEFYRWELVECQQLLDELKSDAGPTESNPNLHASLYQPPGDMDLEIQTDEHPGTAEIYDINGAFTIVPVLSEKISSNFYQPYPTYESCTPTSKNLALRRDALTEAQHLQFIPYADEPDFDAVEYAEHTDEFAWQVDWKDPDGTGTHYAYSAGFTLRMTEEVIHLEVARRLHFQHGLSFDEIDALNIIGKLRTDNASGLLWDTMQRDLPYWSGASISKLPNFTFTHEPDAHGSNPVELALRTDLKARLNVLIRDFCPSLNCVQSLCPTHMHNHPEYQQVKPKTTSERMLLDKEPPCGEQCFRKHATNTDMQIVQWENPTDIKDFLTILEIMPDAVPCDLAKICHKPCREVYLKRTEYFSQTAFLEEGAPDADAPDVGVSPADPPTFLDAESIPRPSTDEISGIVHYEEIHMQFTPQHPCSHVGSCETTKCNCFRTKVHCLRSCICASDCIRRWKGCKCQKSRCDPNPLNGKQRCACIKAERECDVDLCLSCNCRGTLDKDSKKSCKNVAIQKGSAHKLIIKRGKFGLGAFSDKPIKQHEYLGEYVGKIFESGWAPHPLAAKYKELNYNFGLNENLVIDAMSAGNQTRYPNHGSKTANCVAIIKYVNGDHRIGFFASKNIPARAEIFLDYGANYWNENGGVPDD